MIHQNNMTQTSPGSNESPGVYFYCSIELYRGLPLFTMVKFRLKTSYKFVELTRAPVVDIFTGMEPRISVKYRICDFVY